MLLVNIDCSFSIILRIYFWRTENGWKSWKQNRIVFTYISRKRERVRKISEHERFAVLSHRSLCLRFASNKFRYYSGIFDELRLFMHHIYGQLFGNHCMECTESMNECPSGILINDHASLVLFSRRTFIVQMICCMHNLNILRSISVHFALSIALRRRHVAYDRYALVLKSNVDAHHPFVCFLNPLRVHCTIAVYANAQLHIIIYEMTSIE